MRFKNRLQVGQLLAQKMKKYKHEECIVYALPRGGVPVGAEIANYLNAPLDLIIPRKVGHPSWGEYAVCAVTENGTVIYNNKEVEYLDPHWLKEAIEAERAEARRRRRVYLTGRKSVSPKNKIAIIADDGVATGLTMQAALADLAEQHPARIILAIPVGPTSVLKDLLTKADEVVTLIDDQHFKGSVGAYYEEFDQTSDIEVVDLLAGAAARNKHFNESEMG
jgi:predicted phosphoribosyltransferase